MLWLGDALRLTAAASVLNAVRRAAPRLYRSHGNIIWPNNDKIRYRIPRVARLIFKGERGDFETQAQNISLLQHPRVRQPRQTQSHYRLDSKKASLSRNRLPSENLCHAY